MAKVKQKRGEKRVKKQAVILVGLPGNGKSYLRDNLVKDMDGDDVHVFSTDDVLEKFCAEAGLTYSQGFDRFIRKASQESNAQLDDAMDQHRNIIWDQTNLGIKKRRKILSRLKHKYDVECYCILPARNAEEAAEVARRLANRDGKDIPEELYTRMKNGYDVVSLEEGFSKVHYIDIYGKKLDAAERHFVSRFM